MRPRQSSSGPSARTRARRSLACTAQPCATLAAALLLASVPLAAASVSGVVINRSTGEPEPRVAITLISFAQGMDPIEEVYSGTDGAFELAKEVPGMGMLRTDHQGVTYSTMLAPQVDRSNVTIEIYNAVETPLTPIGRILILEPGGSEMVVNESYLYQNATNPPVTFRDAERGSLRFHLPEAAKGVVQVEASGPARTPLNAIAEQTQEPEIYKVDFPIKPGENRISLTYLVPQADRDTFTSRSLYPGLQTRIAVPAGVEVAGEQLGDLGSEPSSGATIYEIEGGGDFTVALSGAGRIQRGSAGGESSSGASSGGGGGGGSSISIEEAGLHKELPWLIGIAVAILALGFFNLYTSKAGGQPQQGK